MIARRRDGALVETYDGERGMLAFLYTTGPGRLILKLLIQLWVSRGGRCISQYAPFKALDWALCAKKQYGSVGLSRQRIFQL